MPKTGHFMLGFHIWRLRRGRGDHHSKMGLGQWRGHMPSLRDLGSDLLRQPSISMPKTGHFMLGFHVWRLRRGWPGRPLGFLISALRAWAWSRIPALPEISGAFMNRIIFIRPVATAVALFAIAQSTNIPPDIDKSGRTITPRPQPHLIYSPADLAHNAVTLPASGTTSASAVVNMSAVTKSTLFVNCTQIANVQVNTYKEDGVTIDGTYMLVTNLPVGAQQIYIASELAPNTTGGTLSVSVRLPQRAFS